MSRYLLALKRILPVMTNRTCLAIILAAGEGTRMKSEMVKVLHPVGGLPMVGHVARAAMAAGGSDVALVVGRDAEQVEAAVRPLVKDVRVHLQTERLGTGHAVLAAKSAIAKGYDDLLIMFGDTPLIDGGALALAREKLAGGAEVVVMGFRPSDPTGYGRLIEKDGELLAIREHKDATPQERQIGFCNGGLMAIAGRDALSMLEAITNDNAKGEYYLTDVVEIARSHGKKVIAIEVDAASVLGVNTRVELSEVESLFQAKRRRELMLAGVSMIAPDTVWLSWDTEIGAETMIEPNVVFRPGVKIAGGVIIRAFCHLEGANVAVGAEIGPFARLRPGAEMGRKSKAGNFVEIKKAKIGEGAKINHLTYIGDAVVGAAANIGAGTITCNYDGYNKHLTQIGAGAFIGSNSALVAPVKIGDNALIAAGSVITQEVPADAVGFARARQSNKPGMAALLNARNKAVKDAKKKE
jgi:bifunctional UDP-N-acetylglucosamine pyrophosphorylase / glucosamine-1-phosphate N-acetyltransferase